MFQITNNVWQGRFAADRLLTSLQFHGITHVLNVSETPTQLKLDDGPFKRLEQVAIRDGVVIPTDLAIEGVRALHEFLCEDEANVYIHCVAGWNRSPTILWLYLIACGVESSVAAEQISGVSIDAVPAHPKLISKQLTDAICEYGQKNFVPHPRPTAIQPSPTTRM